MRTIAPSAFERFAGVCALLTGVSGLAYAIAFLVLVVGDAAPDLGALLSGLFLMLGSFLSTPALVALYQRLKAVNASLALWGTLLTVTGAVGAALHGGYDLANAIHPPITTFPDLPSPVDPRGLLTFGFSGAGLLVMAWLMGQTRGFPRGLAYLLALGAVLAIFLYLGRLIVLTPTSPVVLVPAALAGFVVNPAWSIWLGLVFLTGKTGRTTTTGEA